FILGNVERMPFPDASFDAAVCRAAFHHFAHPVAVLGEMVRVTKPGGRLVILDMLASEDPAKAEYHNRMERLCDPSHARALPGSEFDKMFAAAGLRVVINRARETGYSLSDWLDHGGPPPERRKEITHMMEAAIDRDLSGLRIWREEGEVHFAHNGIAYALEKSR